MKILHLADLHYCAKHYHHVDKAVREALRIAIHEGCTLAVIAGDILEHEIGAHEDAFRTLLETTVEIAHHMPLVILQGTYSHDRLGSLETLKAIQHLTPNPIHIATEPERIGLVDTLTSCEFVTANNSNPPGVSVFLSLIPSLNTADPAVMAEGAAAWFARMARQWATLNTQASDVGIPTILATHGTVTGARTESGYAMVSPDHEFSLDSLAGCACDAVMLGHIHEHQSWEGSGSTVVYPGSIAPLVHGRTSDTGCVVWDLEDGQRAFDFHAIPSRQMHSATYNGPPDMEALEELAATCAAQDAVRIRWTIDQEHVHSVDQLAIRKLFQHVEDLKLEGIINPIESVRAEVISHAVGTPGRLKVWLETTGDTGSEADLLDRLEKLQSLDVDGLVSLIRDRITKAEA